MSWVYSPRSVTEAQEDTRASATATREARHRRAAHRRARARRGRARPAVTRRTARGSYDLGLTDMKAASTIPLVGASRASIIDASAFSSQGLNRYSYVFNDPINNTDPSGFSANGEDSTVGIAGWGAGVVAGAAITAFSPSFGSALVGTVGSGANPAAGFLGGGLAGDARAGGSYSVTPTAAPKASGGSPGGAGALGQNQGLPRYRGYESGEGGGEGTNGTSRPSFDQSSYVDNGRLTPKAQELLKPIFSRFGYDINRVKITFDPAVDTADTSGDHIRLNPDYWSTRPNLKRMQILTHEITHSVQFQRLGSGGMRWRLGVESATHAFSDVYEVPDDLANTSLGRLNPTDSRFTLEAIASRMEDFARTVPRP